MADKVVYQLDEVLRTLLGFICDIETFTDIARFSEKNLRSLRRVPPFKNGMPPDEEVVGQIRTGR